LCYCFFFQAEDGIRARNVTGVQTCALPILMITSSQMLLRLGFPATVLVGTLLLTQGELNLFFFLMFLVAASRIYDPLSGVMMQLSEIFNAMLQLRRMKAIEQEPAQEGTVEYQAKGHDIR